MADTDDDRYQIRLQTADNKTLRYRQEGPVRDIGHYELPALSS